MMAQVRYFIHIVVCLLKVELTDDSDGKGAVGLVPWAVSGNVGDGLLTDGEQLGRGVHWFHLHSHLGGVMMKDVDNCFCFP